VRWGKRKKEESNLVPISRFYPLFVSLFVSGTKILCSAGAKSARVGDLGFSSASDFIYVPLPLVKERE